MNKTIIQSVIVVGLAAPIASVLAGTDSESMTVTATVTSSCTVGAATLSFGNFSVNQLASADQTTSTAIDITCGAGDTVEVALDMGANESAGVRRLTDGAATPNYLSYNLYSDSSHTTEWNATNTVTYTEGSSANPTVYGKIPMVASQTAGTYTDTVLVSVVY